MSFMGQKIEIEAKIMAHQHSYLYKVEKVRKYFACRWSISQHLRRNAGEFDNEGRKTASGIEQALERVDHFTSVQAHSRHFDDSIRSGAQTSRLRINNDKLDIVQ